MSDLPKLSYCRPRGLDEALKALARPGACAYAGGTDLLIALGARQPWTKGVRELVDIKDLKVARGVTEVGDTLRIGALTTADELASSRLVRRKAPALADAAGVTAAPALRRRGTLGGNIVTPHPAGDVTTALIALDATVELVEGTARRERSLADLLDSLAGKRPQRRLILAVRFRAGRPSAFEKHGARTEFSRSIVSAAVTVDGDAVRVALGGLAKRPFFAASVSAAASRGVALDAALVQALADDCHTSRNAAAGALYQLRVARVLVERALGRARRS